MVPSRKRKRSPTPPPLLLRAFPASLTIASAAPAAAPAAPPTIATATTTHKAVTWANPPTADAPPTTATTPPANPCQDLPPSEKVSAAFGAFSQRPAIRRPLLRDNKRKLLLYRQSNREAYLAQSVGRLSAAPCGHCEKEKGPWDQCVVVDGFLVGSCANCHYGGEGTRCSLRLSKFILNFNNISWIRVDSGGFGYKSA